MRAPGAEICHTKKRSAFTVLRPQNVKRDARTARARVRANRVDRLNFEAWNLSGGDWKYKCKNRLISNTKLFCAERLPFFAPLCVS